MSKRNEYDLSPFALRLMGLMESKNCPTAVSLAQKLVEQDLVSVHTRNKTEPKDKIKTKAVEAVRKKIASHLNAKDASCLQGEMALAYAQFFECSLEYLFMRSDVQYPKLEVAEICRMTGLDEDAVINLKDANIQKGNDGRYFMGPSQVWSRMLSSDLFKEIPETYRKAYDVKVKKINDCLALERAKIEYNQACTDDEKEEVQEAINFLRRNVELNESAASGVMFDVSTKIKDFLEADVAQMVEIYSKYVSYTYLNGLVEEASNSIWNKEDDPEF